MEEKSKIIDKILQEFITNEAQATDMRILSIRHFLSALNNAVDKYLEEQTDTESEDKKRLVLMLDDMAEIYRHEISDLLVKRGKLQNYMSIFNSSSKTHNNEKTLPGIKNQQTSSYIN